MRVCDSGTYKALYLSWFGAKDTTQSLWETLVSLLKCRCHRNVVDAWDVLQTSVEGSTVSLAEPDSSSASVR